MHTQELEVNELKFLEPTMSEERKLVSIVLLSTQTSSITIPGKRYNLAVLAYK